MVVFVVKVSHKVKNFIVSQTMLLILIQFSHIDLNFQTVPCVSLTQDPQLYDKFAWFWWACTVWKKLCTEFLLFAHWWTNWLLDCITLKADHSNGLVVTQICRIYIQDPLLQAGLYYLVSASRQVFQRIFFLALC